MGKALIITEKPSVAQDFAKILGSFKRNQGFLENENYVITWCVGHLVEMVYPEEYDEKYKKWKLEDLPFLPMEYKYNVIPAVSKQYDIVHGMLYREDIDTVYWAGDAGKEGQTIEENIRNFGGVKEGMKELRVWIDSQTEEEIRRGLAEAKPMSDYANLGKSGIMRTIEDYAMGINFSRAMSVKYGNLLNDAAGTKSYTAIAVGRVMTCVLGMVVIREREIRGFTETPFYRIGGRFSLLQGSAEETGITAEWKAVEGSRYFESPLLYKENGFKKREDAEAFIAALDGKPAVVKTLEKGTTQKKAPLLFNLAELQAECAKRFKISPDETLQAAQDLYEKKLTTYPRTDARVLSTAVAKEIGKNISRLKGYTSTASYVERIMQEGLYRNIARSAYTDDSKITDHYAIIPTGQLTELKSLSELQKKVFDLIVRRFLSIFYPPAAYETVKLTVEADREQFFAGAKALKQPGWLEIAGKLQEDEKDEGDGEKNESLLKAADSLKPGDILKAEVFEIKEGKTSPPKRYTSGSMVLAMENAGQLIEDEELRAQIKGSGIGTSATRAEIIKKLIRIGYLNLNKKTQVLTPETLGEMVFEIVSLTVPELLNPRMTASWEKGLDGITKGTVVMEEYRQKLEDFIRKETLSMVEKDLRSELLSRIRPFTGKGARGIAARKSLGISCPVCGGEIQTTPFGYGCTNYKNGEGCKFSIGAVAGRTLSEEEVKTLLTEGKTGTLRDFKSKKGKKFDARLMLEKNEEGQVSIRFDFEQVEARKLEGIVCPQCGGAILKTGFGYACEKRNREVQEEESCSFSIGRIAEKELNESQVKELLSTGHTGTIRGFKSKKGKRFDACLVMEKSDKGQVNIRFDFENVEAKKLKDVTCPLCGGEIEVTPFGYACTNHERENPDSCSFLIGRISGVKLKEATVKELLTNGKTGVIEGFIAKTGMMFDAPLKLAEDGRVAFDFPEKQAPVETEISCPKCGQKMSRSQWQLLCGCGFKVFHTVAGVALSDEILQELFTSGKTHEKLTGFTSKAGNLFDAFLKFEEDQIRFEFENQEEIKQGGQNGGTENRESVQSTGNHSSGAF